MLRRSKVQVEKTVVMLTVVNGGIHALTVIQPDIMSEIGMTLNRIFIGPVGRRSIETLRTEFFILIPQPENRTVPFILITEAVITLPRFIVKISPPDISTGLLLLTGDKMTPVAFRFRQTDDTAQVIVTAGFGLDASLTPVVGRN